jgi:hypothetical protein
LPLPLSSRILIGVHLFGGGAMSGRKSGFSGRAFAARFVLAGLSALLAVCSCDDAPPPPPPPVGYLPCDINCPKERREGALCTDGYVTDDTGPGACAHHGDVECWYCR